MTPTSTPQKNSIIALRVILILAAVFGYASFSQAQSYTVAPTPFQTALDNSGHIINNACVWTYAAGTTTAATTYSDNVGTPNTNPIRSDSAGRFSVYLVAGTNYKFVYESSCTPPSHGTTLRTADNITGVPASAATVDFTCTAGEALSAGQAVYMSDGSGGKSQGQCYKADSANTYSSTLPLVIGIVPSAIASGSQGTLRIAGQVTGLSSLTVSSTYYVGTAGAITSTAPTNARKLGAADTTTSLILPLLNPPVNTDNGINDFRLTLTSGTPVTGTDVTAATTVYYTPSGKGNRIALFDSAGTATVYNSAEFSIAVPATTSQMYDVFAFANSGVPTLELLATSRTDNTGLTLATTGVYTKTGDLTRRYVGSFRTTAVSGQTEDSYANRLLWNYYNRVMRPMRVIDATASWTYQTATFRQARATATNQLAVVVGVAEEGIEVSVTGYASNNNANIRRWSAIGEDSTTTPATGSVGELGDQTDNAPVSSIIANRALLRTIPAVGYHTYVWLEKSEATGTTTWYGTSGGSTLAKSGIVGLWRN